MNKIEIIEKLKNSSNIYDLFNNKEKYITEDLIEFEDLELKYLDQKFNYENIDFDISDGDRVTTLYFEIEGNHIAIEYRSSSWGDDEYDVFSVIPKQVVVYEKE